MRIDDYLDLDAIFAPFGPSRGPRHRARRRTAYRRRRFGRGDLKLAILALVEEKPMHGYEVMQVLQERSAGLYRASPGSVYPTLQLLEDQGYVTVQERDGKKVYSVTEEGRTHLDDNRPAVKRIFRRFSGSDERASWCGPFVRPSGAADVSRYLIRLGQTTIQGCLRWSGDEQFANETKRILDRALRDVDEAWEEARKRSQAGHAQAEDRCAEADADASGAGASSDSE